MAIEALRRAPCCLILRLCSIPRDSVCPDFVLDKALPLRPAHRRELGAIVTRIVLEAK